jgi:hypothetical protein
VESTRTYQLLTFSDDDGKSWSDAQLMILPRRGVRAMSASIWIDPQGRLWVFWGQAFGVQDGRYGIFAIISDTPDADELQWSAPRRLGDGIMLNKPTMLSDGDWLLTSSVWKTDNSIKVYASTDQGESFTLRGTTPLSPPSAPVQRRLQGPPAKSKFLAVVTKSRCQQRSWQCGLAA